MYDIPPRVSIKGGPEPGAMSRDFEAGR